VLLKQQFKILINQQNVGHLDQFQMAIFLQPSKDFAVLPIWVHQNNAKAFIRTLSGAIDMLG
jgi:bifunctional DNase/RNase